MEIAWLLETSVSITEPHGHNTVQESGGVIEDSVIVKIGQSSIATQSHLIAEWDAEEHNRPNSVYIGLLSIKIHRKLKR